MFVLDIGQTIKAIIFLCIVAGILLVEIVKCIIKLYKIKIGKYKNCFKCKYYKLNDVSSVGGRCYYTCEITDREDSHDFNDKEYYVKCSRYREEEK